MVVARRASRCYSGAMDKRCPVVPCCALACALACAVAHASDRIAVANEGNIRDRWMLAEGVPLATPVYPPAYLSRGDSVCVAVGYLLNPDGTTSDFALLKAWTSAGTREPVAGYWAAFAGAAGDALKQWRFKPRPEVATPVPVYTVGTFVFGIRGAPTELRKRCALPDLADRLRQLRGAPHREAVVLDRLDLGPANDREL